MSQPPAARYQPDNPNFPNPNVITRPTSALFTDTRPYASYNNLLFENYAATGKVTVAYATGNNTGTIRKPLIVVEGYDPSKVLRDNGVNRVGDYDYNYFVQRADFGATFTRYDATNPNDRFFFNDQLSEVGQYDLIFLNLDNGTDYIQRNAYLLERLIQWVNDTKQPLNGVAQQNVVMGMSTGGLIARYALRDMERRQAAGQASFGHDTKLYISHEAPQQGANVPLGFQYLVSEVANIKLLDFLTAADLSPELGAFARLLNEPATQQLLIYQTTSAGTAVHNAWLNEYNNVMGYPTQCRNIATSGGSECGRPQNFAPGAEILNVQGSGLLDEPFNGFANVGLLASGMIVGAVLGPFVGPAAVFGGFAAGVIMSFGNFEGRVDFVVNALPSQQVQRIYHGKFTICKDVLFGVFSTCLANYQTKNISSDASMLPYDSAPGGIYDLNVVSAGLVSQIGTAIPVQGVRVYVQPQFCFIPTTSALDIGNGTTNFQSADLTRSYSSTNPPVAPFNTPFNNFITASRQNLTHILWNGLNSKWVFQEMEGAPQVFNCQAFCQAAPIIAGPDVLCPGNTTFSFNAPTGTSVSWDPQPPGLVTVIGSATGPSVTLSPAAPGMADAISLTATIRSDCGSFSVRRERIAVGQGSITLMPADPAMALNTATTVSAASLGIVSNLSNRAAWTVTFTSQNGTTNLGFSVRGPVANAIRTPVIDEPGYLTVTRTGQDICGQTVTGEVVINVGAGYRPAPPTATLYPNPARETVDVHIDHADPAHPVTVRLFDSLGQARAEQASAGQESVRLHTDKLPAGLYFVHIMRGKEVLSRQQLRIEK